MILVAVTESETCAQQAAKRFEEAAAQEVGSPRFVLATEDGKCLCWAYGDQEFQLMGETLYPDTFTERVCGKILKEINNKDLKMMTAEEYFKGRALSKISR